MKQGKIEIIQKTGKTYEYTNEKGKIKYILYNIKISAYPDMVNYSYPIDKELSFKENDTIEFEYNQLKNKITKVQKVKQSMYSNYTKQEQSVARLDTGRSILLQVAFKEASQAYIAGKISQDEVETLTNKYFNIIDK
jgi:hypothetical protein